MNPAISIKAYKETGYKYQKYAVKQDKSIKKNTVKPAKRITKNKPGYCVKSKVKPTKRIKNV